MLKNKNKSYPYKKLSVFYKSCLKTFGSHLVCVLVCTVFLYRLYCVFVLFLPCIFIVICFDCTRLGTAATE